MPRRVTPSPDRWLSPTYLNGYVENRNGQATLRYKDKRKSTGHRFTAINRKLCVEMLDAWLKKELEGEESGELPGKKVKGIKKLIAMFKEDRYKQETKASKNLYNATFKQYFPDDGPDIPLRYRDLRRHIDQRKGDVTTAASTNRKRLEAIGRLMQYAIDLELLDRNPMSTIKKVREKRRKLVVFTEEDVRDLCDHFIRRDKEDLRSETLRNGYLHSRWRFMWPFLRITGARPSEALRAEWSHLVDGVLMIIESKHEVTEDLKTGEVTREGRRYIPLNTPPFADLVTLLEELREETGGTGRLFPWWKNTQTVNEALQSAKVALQKTKPERWSTDDIRTVRDFRPSAVARLRDEFGLPREIRVKILGHDEGTQKKHYETEQAIDDLTTAINEMSRRK